MKTVPFLDVTAINKRHEDLFKKCFERILNGGLLVLGTEVELFQSEYADFCNSSHCIGVGNGLDAIYLLLKAYGIGAGDDVLVPSNTYIATWLAVSMVGANPVPVEPSDEFLITADDIKKSLTQKTKGVILVHLYGRMCDVDTVMALAEKESLLIFEDAAQSHGAVTLNNKRPGEFTNGAAFSFYPGKNLGCLGDGGAVVVNDDAIASKIAALRNYGSSKKYINEYKGLNSRLDEIQASFLRIKLKVLDEDNIKRRTLAQRYDYNLAKCSGLFLPRLHSDKEHVWHLYTVRTTLRDDLQKFLGLEGIETLIHYPIPPHQQDAYKEEFDQQFPISEAIHRETLSLPISPVLSLTDVDFISEKIISFFDRCH